MVSEVLTTKSTTVMYFVHQSPLSATYTAEYEDGEIYRAISISNEDFLDFGSPDMITVSVEPGDTING